MIELKNIKKNLKGIEVLSDLNCKFESGKTYLITGPNGCGKTMLLRMICGLITPTDGSISIDSKYSFGVVIESPEFINNETAIGNLKYLASIQNKIDIGTIEEYMEKLDLLKYKKKKVKHFSLGMKQRLGICQAIMENPDVLLLDEPFNAIDDENILRVYNIINEMRNSGKTVIIASHGCIDNEKLIIDKTLQMNAGKLLNDFC